MARALTQDERLRYPWASQITDFVPVGRWRRRGMLFAWGGVALYILGAIGIYVFSSSGLKIWHGVPRGSLTLPLLGLGLLGMAAGFLIGAVTLPRAIIAHGRSPIAWSAAALLPLIIWALAALLA